VVAFFNNFTGYHRLVLMIFFGFLLGAERRVAGLVLGVFTVFVGLSFVFLLILLLGLHCGFFICFGLHLGIKFRGV
jgi:hypothetical protein